MSISVSECNVELFYFKSDAVTFADEEREFVINRS